MSDWLTSDDRTQFISGMNDLWDMFAKSVTIVKEPIYTAIDSGQSFFYGYQNPLPENNYTVQEVSGVFSGLVVSKMPNEKYLQSLDKQTTDGEVFLKVKDDCRAFILDGRANKYVICENQRFNISTVESVSDFLEEKYYYFRLSLTS